MKRRGRAVGAVVPRHTICIGWLLGLALFFCAVRGFAQANDAPRVAAIDWGQAQTLIAIGAPPVAMSQIPAYNDWVSAPAVPAAGVQRHWPLRQLDIPCCLGAGALQ